MKATEKSAYRCEGGNVEPQDTAHSSVSIVVCTCGRGARIAATLRSILAALSLYAEVIVIDQSRDETTAETVAAFLGDPRLRCVRSDSKGLGRARNIGLEQARCEIVMFTDDDCEVEADWLEEPCAVFAAHPNAALCYGVVRAAWHDGAQGYVPDYAIAASHRCDTLRSKLLARGIGANFAVRRNMILQMGGFDARLGAGSDFHSAEDRDITLRCLFAGYEVHECRQSVVVHHGFRNWQEGRLHTRKDWVGLGAAYAKPLRSGKPLAWLFALHEFTRYALVPLLIALLTFRSQKGWTRVTAFFAGLAQGWRAPLDPAALCYIPWPHQEQHSHIARKMPERLNAPAAEYREPETLHI